MADISQELSQIKNSVYGKTMRTAIHDAIKKVNEDGSSSELLKTITWTGSGSTTKTISFTETPSIILALMEGGGGADTETISINPFIFGTTATVTNVTEYTDSSITPTINTTRLTYSGNDMTVIGSTAKTSWDTSNHEYTLIYI